MANFFGVSFNAAKSNFFDREKVMRAVSRGKRRVLSKFGAFVRTRARTSLRYRKETSRPGSPPAAHKSMMRLKTNKKGEQKRQSVSPLRDFLFFSFDVQRESVVIGPVSLNGKVSASTLPALEYGGRSVVRRGKRTVSVTIAARPFMRPAFAAELPGMRSLWRNSVKAA